MRLLRRYLVCGCICLAVTSGFAQQAFEFISDDYNRNLHKHINSTQSNIHSVVQPYLRSDLIKEIHPDSLLYDTTGFEWTRKMLLRSGTPLKKSWRMRFFPMVNLTAGSDFNYRDTRGVYEAGVGIGVGGDIGRKFSFYADVWANHGRYPMYVDDYILSTQVVPGKGYAHPGGAGFSNIDFSGYLSFSPLEPFNIQAGIGKNFWGDGIRSLWLSDQSTSYPFLKITTTIWNIKYVNLFNAMYDIRGSGGSFSNFTLKFSTMHLLSWNISKSVNVSLWESVIWQNRDRDNWQGYDINYLNPIIFYRPVEYAQGSSDRVTIGGSVSVKVGSNTKLFLQLAIDEFLLDSLRAGNGWFGNKQALQVGAKSYDAFGVKGLDLRGEFNVIRPFFYQHVSVKQNHAHYNEPLAHTLGNNLYEVIASASWRKNRMVFDGRFLVARYGRDPANVNLGGNLFRSDSEEPRTQSGHHIAQGIQHFLVSGEVRAGYMIDRRIGLRAEVSYVPRFLTVKGHQQFSHLVMIGIRTALWNQNRLF